MRRITSIRFLRGRRLRLAFVAAVGAALAVPVSASAATDQFLRLSGSQYDGESRDGRYFLRHIEIRSASFAVNRASRFGAPTFGDLIITKTVDRSSPALMLAAASGRPITSALLEVRKAGAMPPAPPYLAYCFQNVVVTSDQVDNGPGDALPKETVTLSYQAVIQSYRPTNFDGTMASPIVAGWSLIQSDAIAAFPTSCGR